MEELCLGDTWVTELSEDLITTYRMEHKSRKKLGISKTFVPKQEMKDFFKELYDFERSAEMCCETIDDCSHKFDFEGKVLCEALSKTFTHREHNFTIEQFKQIMTFDSDDGMQKKWKAFTKKIDVEMEEFPMILQSINDFLWESYTAVINGQVFEKRWKTSIKIWA